MAVASEPLGREVEEPEDLGILAQLGDQLGVIQDQVKIVPGFLEVALL